MSIWSPLFLILMCFIWGWTSKDMETPLGRACLRVMSLLSGWAGVVLLIDYLATG